MGRSSRCFKFCCRILNFASDSAADKTKPRYLPTVKHNKKSCLQAGFFWSFFTFCTVRNIFLPQRSDRSYFLCDTISQHGFPAHKYADFFQSSKRKFIQRYFPCICNIHQSKQTQLHGSTFNMRRKVPRRISPPMQPATIACFSEFRESVFQLQHNLSS